MKPLAEMGRYATVVIDPPWPMAGLGLTDPTKRTIGHQRVGPTALSYPTMDIAEISALPIADVLADDALVFCWAINRYMPYVYTVMAEWGVAYSYTMTWVKPGGIQTPVTPAFNAEWCIVGRKGKPQYHETKAFSTANYWPREGHSAKPEGFYDLLRRVTPGPRLDVFGRRRIAGFDSWGNEAPEGLALPDHYQQVLLET